MNLIPRPLMAFSMLLAAMMSPVLLAAPEVGASAPAFSVVDATGETWTLERLQGQPVVLEWTNHDCPYVRKHYDSGNMQRLQRKAKDQGYLWLSVISSAPGKQGHVDADQATELTASRGAVPTAVLLDESGAMGKAYAASTTPHMYIIDAEGNLVYMGGIDDKPTTDVADIGTATNFIDQAFAALAVGDPIAAAVTRPYGCSVKY